MAFCHPGPGRCPDCPEYFPCDACGVAMVETDGDWCRDCLEAQDDFIAAVQSDEEFVFGEVA